MAPASEKSIFLSALEMGSDKQRREFLEKACAGDARLRAAVAELLAAHERADNVLDSAPPQVELMRAKYEADTEEATQNAAGGAASRKAETAEPPGTLVGPYKLIELIGEGGFGHVYVAEQLHPVHRQVALKILKGGMHSEEVIGRFEAERQALAMMDHPNIAQVFDAGEIDGKPFFVMELVHGVPVTDFCHEYELTVRQRLELFVHVCNAVQHAHQKGIIHRDLKPPNVLVTRHDGDPVVKVIDFGVAKAISQPLTARLIQTHVAQLIGTPLYMSPEQIELGGMDVDTRSDIYSLGVLLYEMLTGYTPFDQQRLASLSFDELRRIIREEEPPRPSAQLTTVRRGVDTIRAVSGPRPRAWASELQGDLDWIVMKSLDKDRTRRYETAAELAADIRRYLNHEPIVARPPSPVYRFGKFARRNKIVLTASTLVLATLVAATAASSWLAYQANAARAEADDLRVEAVEFAEHLKQANVLLDNARANSDNGRWATAYLQHTRATQLQPDHYPVWSGRANLFVRLGLWQQAADDYAKALRLGAPANNPSWWGVPQLCLYAGDRDAYRTVSRQLLRQYRDSPDSMSKFIAMRGCLLEPTEDQPFLEDVVQLAESSLRRVHQGFVVPSFPGPQTQPRPRGGFPDSKMRQGPRRPESGPMPGVGPMGPPSFGPPPELPPYVAGLAHLRAGNARQAIDYLRQSSGSGGWGPSLPSLALPALALAYHDVGQEDETRETLDQVQTAYDCWLALLEQNSVGSLPINWIDFVEFLLLRREAHARITGSDLSDDPRLEALQNRSLEAIGRS